MVIRITPLGFILYSSKPNKKTKKRRRLGGPYRTREEALKREGQVQFFKHRH